MSAGNRGMIAGALVGLLAAAVNWEGNVTRAVSSIVFAAVIGFVVGRLLSKRPRP